MTESHDEQAWRAWYGEKTERMEAILGKEHDMVMHAVIPFALGGGLDLYYFPHAISGTGIATKELSDDPEEAPSNDVFDAYELVMFTKHPLSLDDAHDAATPFGRAHASIQAVLNLIGRFSFQATLNPRETCEFPEEMEDVGGKCLIFDAYGEYPEGKPPFGLLAVIEIFRSEMKYAWAHGGGKLIERLKEAGHYPYSDLDRQPVA